VGRELGVTRERARQLEARALEKLRNLAPELRDYLEVA
jgi:DNA-directed RNA polymerase sigma subunit (sigma70/sigma32)